MKTFLTLVFILIIGATAQAQNATEEIKVATIEISVVDALTGETIELESNTEVARLYKFKNSRIKKALKFTTKRNKSKMA
jgi:hypothetical protein